MPTAELIKKMRPMSEDESSIFEAKLCEESIRSSVKSGRPIYRPYRSLLFTLRRAGLRPGEAYALQPGDLDFNARQILVERALSDGEIDSTKIGEIRRVDMSQGLADELSDFLRWRWEEILRRGWADQLATTPLLRRGRQRPGREQRAEDHESGTRPSQARAQEPLRPPPHFRDAAARQRRAVDLRCRAARPRQAHNDPRVVRSLDSDSVQRPLR